MWHSFNENPDGNRVGDCTIRAISTVLDQDWERTFMEICLQGFIMGDMPSSNAVWGEYLRNRGFCRHLIPESDDEYYTVSDFCRDYPEGTYLLALSGHVVAVIDGEYFDTWDSGHEIPLYCWEKCSCKRKEE